MDSRQPLNEGDGTPWLEILPGEVLRHRITAESGQRIRLWALTLDSRSVPCQIDKDQHGWRLLVPPEQYAAAVYELRRFEELDRNCPPRSSAPSSDGEYPSNTLGPDPSGYLSQYHTARCRGALGNLVNAGLQSPTHSSVGASTAVFGAVGILAALSMVRYGRNLRRRWMLPVAAALALLALLALLGTEGKNSDLGAHLFGFIYGGCLGLITEYLIGRHGRPG